MRILHILDHSLPLHSGYTFRTRAIVKAQLAMGWDFACLTGARHGLDAPINRMIVALLGAARGETHEA